MSSSDSLIGRKLGNYDVIAELGRGGMGVVYQALDTSLQRMVALKIPSDLLMQTPSFAELFEREAQACARLRHPNIVTVYAVGQIDDRAYMAMEHVSGRTLVELIEQDGPLETMQAISIALQTARALAEAHRSDVIHRDISTRNIMIDKTGTVRVLDFGLAKLLHSEKILTVSAGPMGTPFYMSPEQWEGAEIDGRTDIYSLGVVFYEMLTGRPPFDAKTPVGIMRQALDAPFPPIHDDIEDVSDDIEQVLATMVAKDRDERYTSADLLCKDLLAVAGEQKNLNNTTLVKRPATTLVERVAAPESEPASGLSSLVQRILIVILLSMPVAGHLWFVYQSSDKATGESMLDVPSFVSGPFMLVSTLIVLGIFFSLYTIMPYLAISFIASVATLSLLGSHAIFTSQPWQEAFGLIGPAQIGGFAEAARHVLLLVILLRVTNTVFGDEMRRVFTFRGDRRWWFARAFFLVFSALTIYSVSMYHLDPAQAPSDLALQDASWREWHTANPDQPLWDRNPEQFHNEFVVPYWFYLPYSLINYICFFGTILTVGISAAVRDWYSVTHKSHGLGKRLKESSRLVDIKRHFVAFEQTCKEIAEKYIELPCWVMVLFFYEVYIGQQTTGDHSAMITNFAMMLTASVGGVVFFVSLMYQRGFQIVQKSVNDRDPEWIGHKNVLAFLRGLLLDTVAGVLLLAIPVVAIMIRLIQVLVSDAG